MRNKKALVAAVCAVSAVILLAYSGPVLVVRDPVAVADAIVVIGGDHKPERMQHAVGLFKQGWAPVVVISAGTIVLEGRELIPEAEVMREQALALGLPEQAIVLETESHSTLENAVYTNRICQENGYRSILLVTSAYHSRRAKQIFQGIYPASIRVLVQPATQEFCPPCWPLRFDLMSVILYEYQNWLRYWTKVGFQ